MPLGELLRDLGAALKAPRSRDELVVERTRLVDKPPISPASTITAPIEPACKCPTCAHAYSEERERFETFSTWAAQLRAIDAQLYRLTYGNDKECDALGSALAELRGEVLAALDLNRARRWERRITFDVRGRPVGAFDTTAALGQINEDLVALYRRAAEVLPYVNTGDLTKGIDETRSAMRSALERPLEKEISPELAKKAGIQIVDRETEAERLGLRPGPGPSVVEGTIRFAR